MFEVTDHSTKLASVNLRAEKHGEDNVPAADLKFETNVAAPVAESLVPGVRRMLMRKPAVGEQQNLLGEDNLTQLKYPNLAALKFDIDLPGYSLAIARGMGLAPALKLPGDLKRFTVQGIDGGSFGLSFTFACKPEPDQVGELYTMQQEDIYLTLTPPKASRKPKAAKSSDKSDTANDGDDRDPNAVQADAFASALQNADRMQLKAFVFPNDDETVWAGVNAADAAMAAHVETNDLYDADVAHELTDAELDAEWPDEIRRRDPADGSMHTVRALLELLEEPGFVVQRTGGFETAMQDAA
jgi:hypothetical protein